jgi:hypothetical protein
LTAALYKAAGDAATIAANATLVVPYGTDLAFNQ